MVLHLRQHVDRGPGVGKLLEVGLEARQLLADFLELARCRALRIKTNLVVELLEEPQIELSIGDKDDFGKSQDVFTARLRELLVLLSQASSRPLTGWERV